MLRLLDVAGAFQQRTWAPEAEGAFTFALADPLVPDQAGTYQVRVRDGQAEVTRQAAEATPDAGMRLDIRTLSQLYGGYASPTRAAALGQIRVDRPADLQGMQAVLSPPGQPAPFMNDSF
jgi:predicted acetyltransferase